MATPDPNHIMAILMLVTATLTSVYLAYDAYRHHEEQALLILTVICMLCACGTFLSIVRACV